MNATLWNHAAVWPGRHKSTPLLLAASSGALAAVRVLLELGASPTRRDEKGNSVVRLPILRAHVNVLEFFIDSELVNVPVWGTLVGEVKKHG